jgi:hypothetical protein
MADIKYEIVKNMGVLSKTPPSFEHLPQIRYQDFECFLDFCLSYLGEAGWGSNHEKMGKGVNLSREELIALKELLNRMEP